MTWALSSLTPHPLCNLSLSLLVRIKYEIVVHLVISFTLSEVKFSERQITNLSDALLLAARPPKDILRAETPLLLYLACAHFTFH